jgi:hypothetical protein
MAALQAGLVLVAMFANATAKNTAMRIKVLDSETHSIALDDSGVPRNCDQMNYDAYCHSSKTEQITNTLLVQEGSGAPFRVACTIESKFSRCTPLPKGEIFDARREKHGVTIYYQDDDGKARRQLYSFVGPAPGIGPSPPAAPVAAQQPVASQTAVAPVQNTAQRSAPAVEPVPANSQVLPTVSTPEVLSAKVRCNFSSTPAGAEITVDGRYMGSTPSEIGLSTGTHVVVVSMPGFAQWKRELTIVSDSAVNVTAILQKAP